MKKSILLGLILFLYSCAYCQSYELQYKGVLSSALINGYMRDASFYNDTCYFITGGGSKVLMTNLSGNLLSNNFSDKIFDHAKMIHVNDNHVIIMEKSKISFYTKQGVFVRQILISPNILYYYFWVKNKSEIMIVTYNNITVYNYSTGNIIAQFIPPTDFQDEHFVNNGQKLFYVGQKIIAYECLNNSISALNVSTTKYSDFYKSANSYYLSCFTGDATLWFEYEKRDTLYVMDNLLTNVIGTYPLMPISQKPTDDELYMESGNPHLKIFYNQGKIYILKISLNRIYLYTILKS
jgi:hypothetical protein